MQMNQHLTTQKVWGQIQVMLYSCNAPTVPKGTEW